MKNKTLSLMIVSILALVMALSFTSAASLSIENVQGNSTSVVQTEGSFQITFDLINSGLSTDINWSDSIINSGATFDFNIDHIANGSGTPVTEPVIATISFDKTYIGILSGVINAGVVNGGGDDKNFTFSVNVTEDTTDYFCTKGCENYGELEVTIDDVKDFKVEGFGEDDEWYLFDKVDVGVNVKNDGNYNIKRIKIEWELKAGTTTMAEGDLSRKFSLDKKGDNDDFTIPIDLSHSELGKRFDDFDGDKKVVLYVKATGKIDSDDSNDDQDTCAEDSVEVDVNTGEDFVILEGLDDLNTAQCESEVKYILDVWNIGEYDQENVSVQVYNKELGIDEIIEIGDIDAFEEAETPLEFSFKIPPELEEKNYVLSFRVYDGEGDIFESENEDNDDAVFTTVLKVEGNCYLGKAKINATLQEGGKAGEPLVIKTTITNSGTKSTTYSLVAKGFEGWASAVEFSENNFALVPGESRDVLLTFAVNKDASGDNLFDIETYSELGLVSTQPVSVSIEKAGWNPFGEGNMTGFIILNIILVIIIILIVVRIARK